MTTFTDDEIDALFAPRVEAPLPGAMFIRRPCVICRLNLEIMVNAAHRICPNCCADPLRVDAHLLAVEHDLLNRMNVVQSIWTDAWDAADRATRQRWERFAVENERRERGQMPVEHQTTFLRRLAEIMADEADGLGALLRAENRRIEEDRKLAPEVGRLRVMQEQWEIARGGL